MNKILDNEAFPVEERLEMAKVLLEMKDEAYLFCVVGRWKHYKSNDRTTKENVETCKI